MLIYKQFKFKDNQVLLSLKMAVDGMKKPPLLSRYIKRRIEETPNVKIQLTITLGKFYQTEQTHRPFLLKLFTFFPFIQ